MSLTNYIGEAKQTPRRPAGFAMSLVIHGAAFVLLTQMPEVRLPPPTPSEYKQAIEGHEPKLIWYRFNKELPDVKSRSAKAQRKPLKAVNTAKQEIVASPSNAPERTQFVWTPAPELTEVAPLESPNLLAVRLPEPAPPERKPFVAPPDVQRPQTAQIAAAPDAPPLEAKALNPAALHTPQRLVKQFVEPARVAPPKTPVKVEPAPEAPALDAKALTPAVLPAPQKLVKAFVAPPRKVPVKVAEVAPAPEAPQLTASLAASEAAALEFKFKAPVRPFTAPPARGPVSSGAGNPAIPEAPAPTLEPGGLPAAPEALLANLKDLDLAVVGLHPTEQAAALPAAASPAKFSAAPQIRREGADAAGDSKGVSVPDLFVRGAREAKPDLIAQVYAAPTSAENLRAAQRSAEGKPILARVIGETELSPSERTQAAMKVSGAPDPRFNGRDVYMMAIQMPNLTSYSGSWLMWYADRTAKEAGLAPVSPPVAHRKVDPKYIAAAQAEKVEGKVQLACVIDREGHVSAIELVRGLDPRLNQSAREALAKWEFTPAVRDGMPVEVDVLVEIPFRLAPGKAVSY